MNSSRIVPAATVIVVVHNQRESFSSLYQSLLWQDLREPWELIVCDDGSTPAGDVLGDGFVAENVRYVWQPHRGFRAARSRNNGIRMGSGNILIFLDGDMVVPSDFLSSHVAQHDGRNMIVCGTRRTVWSDSYSNLVDLTNLARRARPDESARKPDPRFPVGFGGSGTGNPAGQYPRLFSEMTVGGITDYLKQHWPAIREQLLNGTYEPRPVRRVEIPWDPTFSERSYGFRPGRSAQQAVAQAQKYIAEGHGWCVDLDLEKFLDPAS